MKDKRNAYEIIGTNRDAIIGIKGVDEKDKEAKIDEFLRNKKDDTIRKWEKKKEFLIEQLGKMKDSKKQSDKTQDTKEESDLIKRIEEIEAEIQLIRSAYLEICNQKSRQVYDDLLNLTIRIEGTKARMDRKLTENAYVILRMSRKSCDDERRNSRIIDTNLLRMKNALIKENEDKIKELPKELDSLKGKKDAESYRKKSGIDGQIAMLEQEIERVKNAYNKVATKELRKAYDTELEKLEEQANERIRQSELRKNYKILQSNNPKRMRLVNSNSVRLIKYTSFKISEKERIKQEKEKKRKLSVTLAREDGTPVTVERIGELTYQNAFNQVARIDAYRITRTVDGEKKWDVRYTNLNMVDLSRNPKTGKLQNEEYHDFVANVFLSEDSIEGTGYNDGYLGQALKDKEGNYFHNLRNIDELIAVMKFNEKIKENRKKEKAPESIEGESYEQ